MGNDSRLAEKLEKLNEIGISLSSVRNLRGLIEMIVQEARALTHCDAGSLYIVTGDQLSFEVSQSAVLGESKFTPFTIPMDRSRIAGYVALTGKSLNIEDVYNIPPDAEYGFQRDFDRMMGYRTKSVLAVPMQDHEGKTIGVLQLINALDEKGERVPEDVVAFDKEYERLVFSLASQAAVAIRNARLLEDIQGLFASFVQFCAAAVDARDPCQAGHSRRVRELAVQMAKAINEVGGKRFGGKRFSDDEIEAFSYAAWLHDIGKIAVSEALLTKGNKLSDDRAEIIRLRFLLVKKCLEAMAAAGPLAPEMQALLDGLDDDLKFVTAKIVPGPLSDGDARRLKEIAARRVEGVQGLTTPLLTDEEMENLLIARGSLTKEEYRQVQMHAKYTTEFLNEIPFTGHLEGIPDTAGSHHEMLDGSGYPAKRKGEQISIDARILAVADIFDALTASDRPYKKAMPVDKALGILRDMAERGQLDAALVELFTEKQVYAKVK